MRPTSLPWYAALAVIVAAQSGCHDAASLRASRGTAAEFIVSAGDSAFWLTSDAAGSRRKGAPLQLARVDGRFYEVYVADDDLSFQDAVLVGQRVYRRDLVTGDSLLVFVDTLVPALAQGYTRLHPGDRRLGPMEEGNDEPRWRVTSTLDIDDVHGRFASFALHTDVEREDDPLWHTTRSGVIDLRAGRAATVSDIAGGAAAEVERAAADAQRLARVAVRARRDDRGARAVAVLGRYRFDPTSFTLTSLDGLPAIAFEMPGAGEGDAGNALPLPPIRFAAPPWWTAAIASRPIASADGGRAIWRHGAYQLLVRYDAARERGQLVLRDSSAAERRLGDLPAPVRELFWLDAPVLDTLTRTALVRAFEEAGSYDEHARTAAFRGVRDRARLFL
ncbi:MAG: hypothetical protein H0W68_13155, partial [Gemmatimonadaceae bacterium]|nr:hypothetical protein [Gemmatimonadaceae bacterium]